jgi:signal transduction histidine kinase
MFARKSQYLWQNGRFWPSQSHYLWHPTISYATRGSIGLLNLYERAEVLGGQVSIESAPGQGTKVNLMVPLPPIQL